METKELSTDPVDSYMKDIGNRVYVIAGDYGQFLHWRSINNPNKDRVVYVSSSQRLRGIDPKSKIVFYGTYEGRKDISEIRKLTDQHENVSIYIYKHQAIGPSA